MKKTTRKRNFNRLYRLEIGLVGIIVYCLMLMVMSLGIGLLTGHFIASLRFAAIISDVHADVHVLRDKQVQNDNDIIALKDLLEGRTPVIQDIKLQLTAMSLKVTQMEGSINNIISN